MCAASPSSSTRSPRFKSPSSMRARPTSGARPVHLLRNPVRVAHDRELVVGALDVARRAAGEMHDDLEEQREGQWLRVIDRARVGDRSLHAWPGPCPGNPRSVVVRDSSQRQKIPGSMPVCQTRWRRGTPDRTCVNACLEVLVPGFERAQVKERGPHRPLTNHLQIRIAEARRRAPASPARCHGRCGSRPTRCGAPTCR